MTSCILDGGVVTLFGELSASACYRKGVDVGDIWRHFTAYRQAL